MARALAVVAVVLLVGASPARSSSATPGARPLLARTATGEAVRLSLSPDARVTLELGDARYAGRWRRTAGVVCLRFWSDDAPDLGCLVAVRVGGDAYLIDEDRRVRLELEGVGAGAIELPSLPAQRLP